MKSTLRLNGLDHLRAFAIITVFFYHYGGIFDHHPAWLASISTFGWSGVDLFFVLSGYLIGTQLLRRVSEGRRISISDFYIQRFLRIMPVYWAALTLYFSFPALIERSHLPPLWRFLTFTQNFGLGERGRLGLLAGVVIVHRGAFLFGAADAHRDLLGTEMGKEGLLVRRWPDGS